MFGTSLIQFIQVYLIKLKLLLFYLFPVVQRIGDYIVLLKYAVSKQWFLKLVMDIMLQYGQYGCIQ